MVNKLSMTPQSKHKATLFDEELHDSSCCFFGGLVKWKFEYA